MSFPRFSKFSKHSLREVVAWNVYSSILIQYQHRCKILSKIALKHEIVNTRRFLQTVLTLSTKSFMLHCTFCHSLEHRVYDVFAASLTLKPRTLKTTMLANMEVPQLIRETIMASFLQLFLTGLKLAMAIRPPNDKLSEKKICVAASSHTRGLPRVSN